MCLVQIVNEEIESLGSKNLVLGLYHSMAQLKRWYKSHWRRGLEVEGNAAGNTPSPCPAHMPAGKEEALQWVEAALSSGTEITEREVYVSGKGFLGFGLGFFGDSKELNWRGTFHKGV